MSHILLFVGNELSEQTNDTGKRIPRTKRNDLVQQLERHQFY